MSYKVITHTSDMYVELSGSSIANPTWYNLYLDPATYTPSAPSVSTSWISEYACGSEQIAANVTTDGGLTVTDRGVCYGTSSGPTIRASAGSTGTGTYSVYITGLIAGATYYFRAYAINIQGISYGSEFSNIMNGLPVVTTASVTSITSTTATCGGNSITGNGYSITAYGCCWNTTGSATILDSNTTDGSGTGSFTSSLSSLTSGVTYYVRAYAIGCGTSYGSEISFTAATIPTGLSLSFVTSDINSITAIATVGGDGGSTILQRGIFYDTVYAGQTYQIIDSNTATVGSVTEYVTGLTSNTNYYFTIFASNAIGTAFYSSSSPYATAATTYSQTVYVSIESGGTSSDINVYYYINNPPDLYLGKVTSAPVYPSFSANFTITGIPFGGTVYYGLNGPGFGWISFDANPYPSNGSSFAYCGELNHYASTNTSVFLIAQDTGSGLIYCPPVTTTTTTLNANLPGVNTGTPYNITSSGVYDDGYIYSQGPSGVTNRGFCYCTVASGLAPEAGTYVYLGTGGAGTFTTNTNSLAANTSYRLKCFAVNPFGTAYGSEVDFTTSVVTTTTTTVSTTTTTVSPYKYWLSQAVSSASLACAQTATYNPYVYSFSTESSVSKFYTNLACTTTFISYTILGQYTQGYVSYQIIGTGSGGGRYSGYMDGYGNMSTISSCSSVTTTTTTAPGYSVGIYLQHNWTNSVNAYYTINSGSDTLIGTYISGTTCNLITTLTNITSGTIVTIGIMDGIGVNQLAGNGTSSTSGSISCPALSSHNFCGTYHAGSGGGQGGYSVTITQNTLMAMTLFNDPTNGIWYCLS